MTTRGGAARRLGRHGVLALGAVLLVGCGTGTGTGSGDGSGEGSGNGGGDQTGPSSAIAWPGSTRRLDTAGLVWALDGVVHLGDGTEIDTGRDTSQFVVAGDGVLTGADGVEIALRLPHDDLGAAGVDRLEALARSARPGTRVVTQVRRTP